MGRQRTPTVQDTMRLDAIAKHLNIKTRFPDARFSAEVAAACLARITPVVDKLLPCTGEKIALGLAEHLCLTFEEVHGPHDVQKLENHYLKGKREIGFAQLRGELSQPGVDALLFERMNAEERSPDRWVAVLNLQDSSARGYWNRFHEIAHRIAEPPQGILPFKRHKFEAKNPVESLVDIVAADFAFYAPAFRPIVERIAKRNRLTLDIVEAIRANYAPSASLLASLKATVTHWPRPAVALTAEYRSRLHAPGVDQALRVTQQGHNQSAAKLGLSFFPNMRPPHGSPISKAFQTGIDQDASEYLGDWATSKGKRLTSLEVYTSARKIGTSVYAVISA